MYGRLTPCPTQGPQERLRGLLRLVGRVSEGLRLLVRRRGALPRRRLPDGLRGHGPDRHHTLRMVVQQAVLGQEREQRHGHLRVSLTLSHPSQGTHLNSLQ